MQMDGRCFHYGERKVKIVLFHCFHFFLGITVR